MDEQLEIRLRIGDDALPEELDAAAATLRRELLQLPVTDVQPVSSGPPPSGARGMEALELGALVVALGRTPGLVPSVGQALSAWISSRHGRSAVLQLGDKRIELNGSADEDQAHILAPLFERAQEAAPDDA